jgi:hypothetical protein
MECHIIILVYSETGAIYEVEKVFINEDEAFRYKELRNREVTPRGLQCKMYTRPLVN